MVSRRCRGNALKPRSKRNNVNINIVDRLRDVDKSVVAMSKQLQS